MSGLLRRRGLNGNTTEPFDSHDDCFRIIVRGDGDNTKTITYWAIYIETTWIDGLEIEGAIREYTFGDEELHDIFYRVTNNLPSQSFNYNHYVIDVPNGYTAVTGNQALNVYNNTHHVDIVLRNIAYVGDPLSEWTVRGWSKDKVSLYVPQALIDTYKANANWNRAEILPLETSQYVKRVPIKQLNLKT